MICDVIILLIKMINYASDSGVLPILHGVAVVSAV